MAQKVKAGVVSRGLAALNSIHSRAGPPSPWFGRATGDGADLDEKLPDTGQAGTVHFSLLGGFGYKLTINQNK